jgi:hypothetical protein
VKKFHANNYEDDDVDDGEHEKKKTKKEGILKLY